MQFQNNIMNNPFMMNIIQMLTNYYNQNEYEDVYSEIKEDKKKIIFINALDNNIYKILVPNSLRNNELYYTSQKFKKFKYSEIQLFHNNIFIDDIDENIDYIKDVDIIKIIEQLHGVDFGYYNRYLSKHKDEPKIQIIFNLLSGEKKPFFFCL